MNGRVLAALRMWCVHHDAEDGCSMLRSRYDNCQCQQQAAEIAKLSRLRRAVAWVGDRLRGCRAIK